MSKTFSKKTNFVLIGIIVGLFIGVTVKQALGDTTSVPGTVRSDNLTVNTSGQYTNGLIVAHGNSLVPNGRVGIHITDNLLADLHVNGTAYITGKTVIGVGGQYFPDNSSSTLTVQGNVESTGSMITYGSLCVGGGENCGKQGQNAQICIGNTCVDEGQFRELIAGGDAFTGIVAGWSSSASGPFTDDAQLCNPGTVYQQVTGVNKNSNPPVKGCASPEASNDCWTPAHHRLFTDNEWPNDTTIKTSLDVSLPYYPMGRYNLYLSIGDKVKKMATGTLANCGPQYQWQYMRGTCASPAPELTYFCNASRLGEEHNFQGCISKCVLK